MIRDKGVKSGFDPLERQTLSPFFLSFTMDFDSMFKAIKDRRTLENTLRNSPAFASERLEDTNETALHLVAKWNQFSRVKTLCEFGAAIDAVDWQGSTPLHLAACNGAVRAVSVLLKHGADVTVHDRDGLTALAGAAHSQVENVDKCRTLLKKAGATVDLATAIWLRDLDAAIKLMKEPESSKLSYVKGLIANLTFALQADLDLTLADLQKWEPVVDGLVNIGADVDAGGVQHDNPAIWATANWGTPGSQLALEWLRILLKRGANPNVEVIRMTAFSILTHNARLDQSPNSGLMVKMLLDAGAVPESPNSKPRGWCI
ncbi:MAG: ankyrin repeat domain-containing protein [Pirellulaceae bacterium]